MIGTRNTTEFNFIKIKPITDSRGQTGTFDSSISNVWRRTRELQIKNGLAKRLNKLQQKHAKNVKRIQKHDALKLERKKLLRNLSERKAREVARTQNDKKVTVSSEEYVKVHMNRENFSFADKSMRYGL
jgi:hypothetical protein